MEYEAVHVDVVVNDPSAVVNRSGVDIIVADATAVVIDSAADVAIVVVFCLWQLLLSNL